MPNELEMKAASHELDQALVHAKRIEDRMKRGDKVGEFELDELATSITKGLEHVLDTLKEFAETDDREELLTSANG